MPTGMAPLNWLECKSKLSQAGQVAQRRRDGRSTGYGQVEAVRLARSPSAGGMAPLNWLELRSRYFQVGQVAQRRRDGAAQLVDRLQCKPSQAGQVAQRQTGWRRSTGWSSGGGSARLGRLPSADGMVPLNWFPLRFECLQVG